MIPEEINDDNYCKLPLIDKLTPLARKINSLDLEIVADACINYIPSLVGVRLASLYVLNEDNGILYLKKYNHPYLLNKIVSLNQNPPSPMAIAVNCKQIIKINDIDNFTKPVIKKSQRGYGEKYKTNNCIIIPLISHSRVVGVLNLADRIEGDDFDSEKMAIIELLGQLIGASIGNIKMFEKTQLQAMTDGLTGFVNHRTFYESLEKELNRSSRSIGNLSIVMIDVDNLKGINDTYGHRAGDKALKQISEEIKSCIRQIDIPARYGGDEFAVILSNSTLHQAEIVARRMVESVASSPLRWQQEKVPLSISIGICEYDSSTSAENVISKSDKALYEAKKAGKNTIRIFQENQGCLFRDDILN